MLKVSKNFWKYFDKFYSISVHLIPKSMTHFCKMSLSQKLQK